MIKRKDNLNLSTWSGGSTAELFIFPDSSRYQDRNFEIRISSATINESPSTFTLLPDYHRLLMPIDAPLKLVFNGQNEISLKPLEIAEFEGAWKTTSHGICTDIGIMHSPNWLGTIFVVSDGIFECASGFTGVYATYDNIKIYVDNAEYILMKGDFFILETENTILLTFSKKDTLIITHVMKIK